ncbi:MAG: TIGR00299 family protein [Caldiserica bacterium]|nr:MAG: TIGR00299 family protein [Caldisericota bacterium]
MKILYFDCTSGVSGDMLLSSLFSILGIDKFKELKGRIPFSDVDVSIKNVLRSEISCLQIEVRRENDQPKNIDEVFEIIDNSIFDEDIKEKGKKIFRMIAETEAELHRKDITEIHLHELSFIDSIFEILGVLFAIKELNVEKIYSSKIPVGRGVIEILHGKIPVPAPATLEILKGLPIYQVPIEEEITTPTGSAILKNIVSEFGVFPEMKVIDIGYGAGKKEILELPNFLRAILGERIFT